MVDDAALPPSFSPPTAIDRERAGVSYLGARPTPELLAHLVDRIAAARRGLLDARPEELVEAWCGAVSDLDPEGGALWPELAEPLRRLTGLSEAGLSAAMRVVLDGVDEEAAQALFREAEGLGPSSVGSASPILVVLASNLPALAVQPLLAALALRRPVVVKSSSAEPLWTPAFLRALAKRSPAIAEAWAAITWPGGDGALESPLLAAADPVLAYGETASIESLAARATGRVVGYGPKLSVGYVAEGADPVVAARGLARDIALFDQRGCLSVQAVFTEGEPSALVAALSEALREIANELPAGPIDGAAAARVQQLRLDADLRGLPRADTDLGHGTVLFDPESALRPSPGLRTVTVHAADPAERGALDRRWAVWRGRIQGVAVAGDTDTDFAESLARLEVSRIAPVGELQRVDASWHNGGRSPVATILDVGADRETETRSPARHSSEGGE